jgi:hypothetical protein
MLFCHATGYRRTSFSCLPDASHLAILKSIRSQADAVTYQALVRSSKHLHRVSQDFGDEEVLFVCNESGVQGTLEHLKDKWGRMTSFTLVTSSHPDNQNTITSQLVPKLLEQCAAASQATGQKPPLRFLCISDRLLGPHMPQLASTFEHMGCMELHLPLPRSDQREGLKKAQLEGIAALNQLTGLTSLRLKTTLGEHGDMQALLPLKLVRFGWEGRYAVDAAQHLTRLKDLRHLQLYQPHSSANVSNLAPLTQVTRLELAALGMEASLCEETSLEMLAPFLVSLEFHKFLSTSLTPLSKLAALTCLTSLHLPENLKLPVAKEENAGEMVLHGRDTWTSRMPAADRQAVGKAVQQLTTLESLTLNACAAAEPLIKAVEKWPAALQKLELIDADPALIGNVLAALTALTWLHIRPQQCSKGPTWDTLLAPLGSRLVHLRIPASLVSEGGGSWLRSMVWLHTLELTGKPVMDNYHSHKQKKRADALVAALNTALEEGGVPTLRRLLLQSRWNNAADFSGVYHIRRILSNHNRTNILVALEPRSDWDLRTTKRMTTIIDSI